MKAISNNICNTIEARLIAGDTYQAVSRTTGVSIATISRIAKNRNVESHQKRGRKPKISDHHARLILRRFLTGAYATAVEAAEQLAAEGTVVHPQTIRNLLHAANFKAIIKKPALPLTSARKKARLAFAKKYKDWTVADWKRVIFSDETKVNRLGSDGLLWSWRNSDMPLQDHNVNHTYKHGGGSLVLWSCITAEGPGYITWIQGTMDSTLYCKILEDDLQKTLDDYHLSLQDIIFQHDNDPKHTSKMTRQWLKDHEVNVLDWPAYSPDLNPIENLWFYLKCQLAKYNEPPAGINDLWERIRVVWYKKVTKEMCLKHIESMPKRLQAVIRAKGGETKW